MHVCASTVPWPPGSVLSFGHAKLPPPRHGSLAAGVASWLSWPVIYVWTPIACHFSQTIGRAGWTKSTFVVQKTDFFFSSVREMQIWQEQNLAAEMCTNILSTLLGPECREAGTTTTTRTKVWARVCWNYVIIYKFTCHFDFYWNKNIERRKKCARAPAVINLNDLLIND